MKWNIGFSVISFFNEAWGICEIYEINKHLVFIDCFFMGRVFKALSLRSQLYTVILIYNYAYLNSNKWNRKEQIEWFKKKQMFILISPNYVHNFGKVQIEPTRNMTKCFV